MGKSSNSENVDLTENLEQSGNDGHSAATIGSGDFENSGEYEESSYNVISKRSKIGTERNGEY